MSINQLYEMSRRSFRAYQAGMDTVGQNVANADTDGYHRRRVTLRADSTVSPGVLMPSPRGQATGTGVSIGGFERVRDRLLESSAREARTGQGAADEESRILSALEGVFAVGSEGALPEVLGRFWDGWGDVAANPTDTGARAALLSRTDTLTGALGRLDRGLTQIETQTQSALGSGLDEINGTIKEIGALNQQIREAQFKGSPDLVAEDRRDALVKDLSAFAPARVREKEDGYTVTIGGMSVVQGAETTSLERVGPPQQAKTEVRFAGTDIAFQPEAGADGKLGAWVRTLNETLPGVRSQLDGFAQDLVEKVNAAHRDGYDQNEATGTDFFDPEGVTAGTIRRAVQTPDAVAAAGHPGSPGDSEQATAIGGLHKDLDAAAIDLIAGVGARVKQASAASEAQAAVVDHLDGMARGVSGVSVDEELTNMIEYQQAFAASARVLTTAQSMMDTLLQM